MSKLSILLVIPCYNEEQRLPVKEIDHFLKHSNGIDLLFVNDGSTDNTIKVLKQLKEKSANVEILDLKKNRGKAEAVRTAMLKYKDSSYDYIGYFDADMASPLEEAQHFAEKTHEHGPLLIMGSRVKLLGSTEIARKRYRHYFGRVFATVVSWMLKLSVYDTQCGAKLIHRKAVSTAFDEKFTSAWLFDVEILFRLKKSSIFQSHACPIIEVPLKKWEDKGESKIPLDYLFKIPFELFLISKRYKK